MKTLLIVWSVMLGILAYSQNEETDIFKEITREIKLPFITPDELPSVGVMADEESHYTEDEKVKEELAKNARLYPDITEKMLKTLGEDSELAVSNCMMNGFGKFRIGDIQYIMLIATGIDEYSGFPYESLVIVALYKGFHYKDELYVKYDISFDELDEFGDSKFSLTLASSKIEAKEGTLFITTTEDFSKEFIGAEESTILEEKTTVNHFKFVLPDGYFDLFKIEN